MDMAWIIYLYVIDLIGDLLDLLKYIPYVNIIGAVFVSLNEPVLANCVWAITNPLLTYSNYKAGSFEQARMFGIFFVIALLGLVRELVI